MKGYVQVYTGDGKGKTTAAIGLAIRALGAGKKVCLLQFMKEKTYSEHKVLAGIAENLTVMTFGKPFFIVPEGMADPAVLAKMDDEVVVFPQGEPPLAYTDLIQEGIAAAQKAVTGDAYDMVILDEVIMALHFGLTDWHVIKDIIEKKADGVELILTGRKAPQELVNIADLVTEMKEIKHYYTVGVEARKGIEC